MEVLPRDLRAKDCSVGFDNWRLGWSILKQQWCCSLADWEIQGSLESLLEFVRDTCDVQRIFLSANFHRVTEICDTRSPNKPFSNRLEESVLFFCKLHVLPRWFQQILAACPHVCATLAEVNMRHVAALPQQLYSRYLLIAFMVWLGRFFAKRCKPHFLYQNVPKTFLLGFSCYLLWTRQTTESIWSFGSSRTLDIWHVRSHISGLEQSRASVVHTLTWAVITKSQSYLPLGLKTESS